MRIFAISDLHLSFSSDKPMDIFGSQWDNHFEVIKENWQSRVTNDDIVLVAGDISWAMSFENAKIDLAEIAKLTGKKFLIRGNHDYWWPSYKKLQDFLPPDLFCIQNNAIKCGDYIICGTRGWTIPEKDIGEENKYISREAIRLEMTIKDAIRQQTNGEKVVLMMHYPPFNSKLDNSIFTDIISSFDITAVVYGHLHGENIRFLPVVNKGKTNYYITSCDLLKNKLLDLTDLI